MIIRATNTLGGPPGAVPTWQEPGSDVILAHEMIHGVHNATATHGTGSLDNQRIQVNEERQTTGLPAQTYTGAPGDPMNGNALPDTTGGAYNENKVRDDYRERGVPSPVNGQPPVRRPSYYFGSGAPPAPQAGNPF